MARRFSAFIGGGHGRRLFPGVPRHQDGSFVSGAFFGVFGSELAYELLLVSIDGDCSPKRWTALFSGVDLSLPHSGLTCSIFLGPCPLAASASFLRRARSSAALNHGALAGLFRIHRHVFSCAGLRCRGHTGTSRYARSSACFGLCTFACFTREALIVAQPCGVGLLLSPGLPSSFVAGGQGSCRCNPQGRAARTNHIPYITRSRSYASVSGRRRSRRPGTPACTRYNQCKAIHRCGPPAAAARRRFRH